MSHYDEKGYKANELFIFPYNNKGEKELHVEAIPDEWLGVWKSVLGQLDSEREEENSAVSKEIDVINTHAKERDTPSQMRFNRSVVEHEEKLRDIRIKNKQTDFQWDRVVKLADREEGK